MSVLVVDDDPQSRMAIAETLRILCDSVHTAASGTDALRRLETQDYAVVILDVRMAGMTGFEAAQRIRSQEATRHIPIIFLTGVQRREADIARGYQLGAVDYLEKPVVVEVLRAKVAVFIELFKKRVELEKAQVQQHRYREQQEYLKELQVTLERYRRLSSAGVTTTVTHSLAGAAPLKEREPRLFSSLANAYRGVLDAYLHQLVVQAPKPVRDMRIIIKRLGDSGGTPRDLLDIHLEAIESAIASKGGNRARAYAVEGRLLALEVMGMLADYYRLGLHGLLQEWWNEP